MQGFFPASAVLQERPMGTIPKCGSCGLLKTCRSPKMVVAGDGARRVLVVGEAPGAVEDEEGEPFVGPAGQHLRDVLRGMGVRLNRDAWITNSLICRPPNNATPTKDQIGYCRPNLVRSIEENAPRVILALGRAALVSVIGPYWKEDIGEMSRWVGWTIPLENHWVIPTYHPSYLLRMDNRLLNRMFEEHLETAFTMEDEPPRQPDWRSKIDLLYDEEEIIDALERMDRKDDWAAVDYEGNCLKPEYPRGKIYSLAVSTPLRAISFPWVGKAIDAAGRFLASPNTRKIASNCKMEERWTRKIFGHGVNNWGWDTMLAAHCLDNRRGICSLKFQALVKLGVSIYNKNVEPFLKSHKGHYNRIHEVDSTSLLTYGGMDAILERYLARVQREEMGYAD